MDKGEFGTIKVNFAGGQEDGRWFSRRQIERKFSDIVPGAPFNYKIYDSVSGINSHPDLTVDAQIECAAPCRNCSTAFPVTPRC